MIHLRKNPQSVPRPRLGPTRLAHVAAGRSISFAVKIKRGVEKMLALEEIMRKLGPYAAKLIEMGDSL